MVSKKELFEVREKRLKLFLKNGYIYTGQIIDCHEETTFIFFDKFGNNITLTYDMVEAFAVISWPDGVYNG